MPAVVIESLDDADKVLREMAECARSVDKIKADMNEAIDLEKSLAAEQASPLLARHKELAESLAAYATYRKSDLFSKRKTLQRVFGRFGFRESTEIKPKAGSTWQKVLEALQAQKIYDGIRIKEEVNKEALASWTDQRLATVESRRVKSDKFWVEVDQEALEESNSGS